MMTTADEYVKNGVIVGRMTNFPLKKTILCRLCYIYILHLQTDFF